MNEKKSQDILYRLLLHYEGAIFRCAYRRYRCTGLDNIPKDGAIIFAPNHTNGFCDALTMLTIDMQPKMFASRADIFRNPLAARFWRKMKMVPVKRMRDGLSEVRHNNETFAEAISALRARTPFVIFAEGTHRAARGLLEPLSKGIFRIALQAAEDGGKVYIVPVGINYGDFFHLRDTLDITIDRPISVALTDESLPIQINHLREKLTERLKALAWAEQPARPAHNLRRIRTLLAITSPIALMAAIPTLPIWLPMAFAYRYMEDDAFYNSLHLILLSISCMLTLGLIMPFWIVLEEWKYWWRIARS